MVLGVDPGTQKLGVAVMTWPPTQFVWGLTLKWRGTVWERMVLMHRDLLSLGRTVHPWLVGVEQPRGLRGNAQWLMGCLALVVATVPDRGSFLVAVNPQGALPEPYFSILEGLRTHLDEHQTDAARAAMRAYLAYTAGGSTGCEIVRIP